MTIARYYHTLIHLKPIQIRYQLWYRIRRYRRKMTRFACPLAIPHEGRPLSFTAWIDKPVSWNDNTFTFLNKTMKFGKDGIDWNFHKYGKLWTYNLNYFDYLLQPGADPAAATELIRHFISGITNRHIALDPYAIALRGINWIKFLSRNRVTDPAFNASLYAQYKILHSTPEYHLLGNHLLEDAFSLLIGSFYFNDEKFYKSASGILKSELKEQILSDGGHFELSPMYHQIMLDRLLDCINLLQNNHCFEDQNALLAVMCQKAGKMLQWLHAMTFSNGDVPLFNDSAPGIAASPRQLTEYAARLGLPAAENSLHSGTLSDSGYRKFTGENYEAIIDIGAPGPSYQPGHAHADTFSFVLNVNQKPILIDPGISTYEANQTRLSERGTAFHNTVTVKGRDSSEVWSSFRMGRRAAVHLIHQSGHEIICEHDGFAELSAIHRREWYFSEKDIQINDILKGKNTEGKAHFWLAPQLTPLRRKNTVFLRDAKMTLTNAARIELIKTTIPRGYNRFTTSYKIEVTFHHHLNIRISGL